MKVQTILKRNIKPKMPDFTHVNINAGAVYVGPDYDKTVRARKNYSPSWTPTFHPQNPVMLTEGKYQYVWDEQGKRYLDAFGGVNTTSVGHCHPRLNEALKSQIDKLWHTTTGYMHDTFEAYAEKLLSKLPKKYTKVHLVNSGSEANELLIQLAQNYTGRQEILTAKNCYHGATNLTAQMTSLSNWRGYHLSSSFVRHVESHDPYRAIYGGARAGPTHDMVTSHCDPAKAGKIYAKEVQETIDYATNGKPAGLWLEGLQGVGGLVQWADGFVEESFKIAKANGMATVMDEVQTGYGRLGSHYWAFMSHCKDEANYPDAITLAKSMGNGYPMGGFACTEEFGNSIQGKLTFNTYGANPLACVVGKTVLDIIDDENLVENVDVLGKVLIEGLNDMKAKYEIIGDVRGRGFMIGIEFVKSKAGKEQNTPAAVEMWELLRQEGILVGKGGFHGNTLRVQPPMCWTEEDVKFFLQVFDHCMGKVHV